MSYVQESDTVMWLENQLGTSNDSWICGSICRLLNKEVLRNIKNAFSLLQTQVKVKLLLSFFHIPRHLAEEWKSELEEILDTAGLDSEAWVKLLAETLKTYPATNSLNIDISQHEETRRIFTEIVNDLGKLAAEDNNLRMQPMEWQYLNTNALISVGGQQPAPVMHFKLKGNSKSDILRAELLRKSAEAQATLKKETEPAIPLRSRGMPRKMADIRPFRGIPAGVSTPCIPSPTINAITAQRPNLNRTPAGRKDGGIKLIELPEQPLSYAAAKKLKREQKLERGKQENQTDKKI